jgi:hypothetical protein
MFSLSVYLFPVQVLATMGIGKYVANHYENKQINCSDNQPDFV